MSNEEETYNYDGSDWTVPPKTTADLEAEIAALRDALQDMLPPHGGCCCAFDYDTHVIVTAESCQCSPRVKAAREVLTRSAPSKTATSLEVEIGALRERAAHLIALARQGWESARALAIAHVVPAPATGKPSATERRADEVLAELDESEE